MLTVENASQVFFGGADDDLDGLPLADLGRVEQILTEGAVNIGSVTIISGGITFNGGPGAADLTVLSTTNDNVRLNGPVTLNSSLRIDTSSGIGDILFTNDSPVDSQTGEFNDLTLNSGTGIVSFNEDLGSAQRLGMLTVENASQVFFGGADDDLDGLPLADLGRVEQILTEGAVRSEERRVGKECRSCWSQPHEEEKTRLSNTNENVR